jgi:hypothetical protein
MFKILKKKQKFIFLLKNAIRKIKVYRYEIIYLC